jgi:hypothetical protein
LSVLLQEEVQCIKWFMMMGLDSQVQSNCPTAFHGMLLLRLQIQVWCVICTWYR